MLSLAGQARGLAICPTWSGSAGVWGCGTSSCLGSCHRRHGGLHLAYWPRKNSDALVARNLGEGKLPPQQAATQGGCRRCTGLPKPAKLERWLCKGILRNAYQLSTTGDRRNIVCENSLGTSPPASASVAHACAVSPVQLDAITANSWLQTPASPTGTGARPLSPCTG